MLLALVLVLMSLTACGQAPREEEDGGDKTNETPVENENESKQETEEQQEENVVEEPSYDFGGRKIRWAAWWDLGPVEGASETADKQLERIAELEEKYNFKLEFLNLPYNELLEQFAASTLAGDPIAEFIQLENYYFLSHVISGMVLPVSDLNIFDFNEDKWDKRIIRDTTWNGKVYGLATGKKAPENALIWWNKTMFERNGLPNLYELQRNKEWTWDKMLEIAVKATVDLDGDGTVDQWGLAGASPELALIYSNNGQTVRAEDGKLRFALMEPNALEALQFYQDLIHTHKVFAVPPANSSWDWAIQQFISGKVAMNIEGAWVCGMLDDGMADEYGVVAFPIGPKGTDYVAAIGTENYTIMPSTVKKPEEAAIFYDAYTGPFEGEDPDAWKEGYEINLRDAESLETLEMMIENQASVAVLHRSVPEVANLLGGTFYQITTGAKTAKAAVEEIAQQAQTLLDDFLTQK